MSDMPRVVVANLSVSVVAWFTEDVVSVYPITIPSFYSLNEPRILKESP